MTHIANASPALIFALALAIGMLAQVVARHVQIPGIVLLLAAGVVFGPDVLNMVRPQELGSAVQTIVGIAVAIILFEGGLHLDVRRLRAEAKVIRRLVTVGGIITALGGTLAARYIMHWDWRLSLLFGTLVIVTGPTVVTPLIRRLRVQPPVSTILEAEGVLIDPIGAIIAVVALEFLYATNANATLLARPAAVLAGGAAFGLIGGIVIALLLRPRRLVPEGLENVLVLSLVVALFELSEGLLAESGLAAVVAAGLTVGNLRTRVGQGLLEFKEQVTVLMIGLLFVLLASDVRLAEVRALGWPALATVAALMLVVRPIEAYLCTAGAHLSWRERTFIALLAPRGIVAAAIASLFAETITARGLPGGAELRALMFIVIAVSVTVHGLTGGFIARALRVYRPSEQGYVILGANGLSLALARLLREDQPEIVFIDSNPDHVMRAQRQGFQALYGQGLLASVLSSVDLDTKLGCIALTPNEEVNLLWATRVRAETHAPRTWVALRADARSLPTEQAHDVGAVVLFGRGQPVDLWSNRLQNGEAAVERWRHERSPATLAGPEASGAQPVATDALILLTVRRSGRVRPFDDETSPRERDEADVAIFLTRRQEAESWLRERNWAPVEAEEAALL